MNRDQGSGENERARKRENGYQLTRLQTDEDQRPETRRNQELAVNVCQLMVDLGWKDEGREERARRMSRWIRTEGERKSYNERVTMGGLRGLGCLKSASGAQKSGSEGKKRKTRDTVDERTRRKEVRETGLPER